MCTGMRLWRWFSTISLLVLLTACGGKGSSFSNFGNQVDPSSSYHGARNQAVVTSDNATNLAVGGFEASTAGSIFGTNSGITKKATAAGAIDRPLQKVLDALKQSTRRMNVPAASPHTVKTARSAASGTAAKRTVTYQLPGQGGGTASYSLDINDTDGSFYGTITYAGYTSSGIVFNGAATIIGTLDSARQAFSRVTLSFQSLSVSNGSTPATLVGSMSWNYNYPINSDTFTMNMVIAQGTATYWYNNYQIFTTYGSDSGTQMISGRYYDPGYGYVDFATKSGIVVDYGNSWPSQGIIEFAGAPAQQGRTRIDLTFNPQSMSIDADVNGDGVIEYHTDVQTNGTPVATNTPPVANAGADVTVAQGTVVSLNGSGSYDPDGDPISYSWMFTSCPGSTAPILANATTATPSFIAATAGTYTLQLTVYDGTSAGTPDSVTVTVNQAPPPTSAAKQLQWQFGSFGASIGNSGIVTTDLDGDGTAEVIAAAAGGGFSADSFWYILKKGSGNAFNQIWRSESYPASILKMAMADVTGDGTKDIVVGFADGTVLVYDGVSRQKVSTFKLGPSMTTFEVADIDGDGIQEIVTSDGTGIFVYSSTTGEFKWSIAGGGGYSMAIGNVDSDADIEIVTTTSGGSGYVVDATTHAIKWEYINSFGSRVALGDLYGTGRKQIVGAAGWYKITVFDADHKSPDWEIATSLDIGAMSVIDTDGDGYPEIVYGDQQGGTVHAIDSRTHTQKWSIGSPRSGQSSFVLGDIDGDGKNELLWGAGWYDTGADYLYVADPVAATIKWHTPDFGDFHAVAVGDVDGDGKDEIVAISQESESGYESGSIFVFDAETHALKVQKKLPTYDWSWNHTVRLADVDGDGKLEIVVTASQFSSGMIQVYDGATLAIKGQSAQYSSGYLSGLAIGDVDGDGKPELVSSANGNIVVIDPITMQEKWRSVQMGSIYDIEIGDIDADGHPEIVASVAGSRLMVFDGVTHNLKLLLQHPSYALALADVDGDGVPDIVAGRQDGLIDVFDGKTFTVKQTVSSFTSGAVYALRVADADGDGVPELVAAGGGVLTIVSADGQSLQWQSGSFDSTLGLDNHLAVLDLNRDGLQEIVVGSNQVVSQFH